MKHLALPVLAVLALTCSTVVAGDLTEEMKKEGWVSIFDGQTLDGWKSNEKYVGFEVKDGCIIGSGKRNHLYYMGEEYKNFELRIDCKISAGGNSGVYIKSQWQDEAWPVTGFELQVNSSHTDPVKTGSIYNIVKIFKAPHGDDEWFTYHLICKGNSLEVRVNDQVLFTYVDPMEKGGAPSEMITEQTKRISQKGYVSLQQHDPKSIPAFKNIFVKKLPD